MVEGYQSFAENINRYPVSDPKGRNLSCLSTNTKPQLGEEATYDALHKRVKLHNIQIKSGTEAYEAEAKALMSQEDADNSLQVCHIHDPLVMLKDVKFLERNNPIADKFHILTREDSVSAS